MRKSNEIKLPAIQSKAKDSLKILSNTMPENTAKARPSSLNKVDDLQKKLFSKLEAYEAVTKKGSSKRPNRARKLDYIQNGADGELQGYDKLQRLMPALYSKLVQAKKGSLVEMTPSTIETPSYKSQSRIINREQLSSSSFKGREQRQISIFVTSKEPKEQTVGMQMSSEQMNQLYSEYIMKQNLSKQTSNKELQDLSKSMLVCEKQIEQLTKSMQGLIREIGMECLLTYEQDQLK